MSHTVVGAIQSPAQATYWVIKGWLLFPIIYLLGSGCFFYIIARRLSPLLRAERDFRFDRPWKRLGRVLQFWLVQWRHPRYRVAGVIHVLIFAGFSAAFFLVVGSCREDSDFCLLPPGYRLLSPISWLRTPAYWPFSAILFASSIFSSSELRGCPEASAF